MIALSATGDKYPFMNNELSIKNMLDVGAHFGHQIQKWNPKMKSYVYTARSGIHIIDLQKTLTCAKNALQATEEITAKGGSFIFVGTKKQAANCIRSQAIQAGQFYVSKRWLGGTLTNFQTIKVSIDRMKKIDQMKERGDLDHYSKKEKARIEKEYNRLNEYLNGIREMKQLPQALFVVDINRENIAVAEAARLNIPIIALVDTNCDPHNIDYPIPANDDSSRSIEFFIKLVSQACIKGKKKWTESLRSQMQQQKAGSAEEKEMIKTGMDRITSNTRTDGGPTVVKVFKNVKERKLVAAGLADDVEISIELDSNKK